jgi:hypothetical protein
LIEDEEHTKKKGKTKFDFSKEQEITSILLFRYSALTFNSHKIHFDWKYVTEVEKYPGKSNNPKETIFSTLPRFSEKDCWFMVL